MKFSIIIPAYNEEKLLAESLTALQCSAAVLTEAGHLVEWIVCDNNSTDQTASIAQEHGAKVVFEPINQISRARNAGASIASGDYLIFVDADSYPPPALFQEMLQQLNTGRVVGVGALVNMETTDVVTLFTLHLWRSVSRLFRWAAGSFIFCRRDLFIQLKGFSTDLYASEEIDFSKQLKKLIRPLGLKMVILHTAIQTSNRKLHLYGTKDYLRLCGRFLLHGSKLLKDKNALHIWYDGKR